MVDQKPFEVIIAGETVFSSFSYIVTDRDDIAAYPGVYLLRDCDTNAVLYVGTSQNIYHRLQSHHIYEPSLHIVEVIYLSDDRTRIWLEAILGSSLSPPGNADMNGIRLGFAGGYLWMRPGYTKSEPEQLILIDSPAPYAA